MDQKMKSRCPRIMIAAQASGSGKTMITCGLLALLKKRGLRPAAFKCGPDYIDPMFHKQVLGVESRNLDPFFCNGLQNQRLMMQRMMDQDIAVVEGVMGYYDGIGAVTTRASSYELAGQLQIPVLLTVQAHGVGGSAAAIVKGFSEYKKPSYIRGVLLNHASPGTYEGLKQLIEQETGIPVLGYVPKMEMVRIPSRHLGLYMPEEIRGIGHQVEELAGIMEETLDVGRILNLADSAAPLPLPGQNQGLLFEPEKSAVCSEHMQQTHIQEKVTLGVARDEAFCFMYEDNLELLRKSGMQIRFFSPIRDAQLPGEADGIWLPGGYPELHTAALGANTSMLRSIREAVIRGMPAVAECGGFLYLHETLEDEEGNAVPMVGVVGAAAARSKHLGNFGYIHLKAVRHTLLLKQGESAPSHEFHYWKSQQEGDACVAEKASGARQWPCVWTGGYQNLFAGFPHIYLPAKPEMGIRLASACLNYKKLRT